MKKKMFYYICRECDDFIGLFNSLPRVKMQCTECGNLGKPKKKIELVDEDGFLKPVRVFD